MEIGCTTKEESLGSRAKPYMGQLNLQAVSVNHCSAGSEDCW